MPSVKPRLLIHSTSSDAGLWGSCWVQAGSQWPGLIFSCGPSAADGSTLATCHYCSVPVSGICCRPGCSDQRHRQTHWENQLIICGCEGLQALGPDFRLNNHMHHTQTWISAPDVLHIRHGPRLLNPVLLVTTCLSIGFSLHSIYTICIWQLLSLCRFTNLYIIFN